MSVNYQVHFAFKESLDDETEKGGETSVTCEHPIQSEDDYYQVSKAIGQKHRYATVRILFTIPPVENMEEIIASANKRKQRDSAFGIIEGEIVE